MASERDRLQEHGTPFRLLDRKPIRFRVPTFYAFFDPSLANGTTGGRPAVPGMSYYPRFYWNGVEGIFLGSGRTARREVVSVSMRLAIAIAVLPLAGGLRPLPTSLTAPSRARGEPMPQPASPQRRSGRSTRESRSSRFAESDVAGTRQQNRICLRANASRSCLLLGSILRRPIGNRWSSMHQPITEDGDWYVAAATPPFPFPTKPVADVRFMFRFREGLDDGRGVRG